jgi:molybdate transport system ATP-binding protein
VAAIEPRIDRILVHLIGPPDLTAAITPAAASELRLAPGSRLWASAKALDLAAYARPGAAADGTAID